MLSTQKRFRNGAKILALICDDSRFCKRQHYNITNLYRYKALFRIHETEILGLFKDIPFLNGGLFGCLDKPHATKKTARGNEETIRVDGFSDRADNVLKVPELLGKVFENLLASFNPETQTTARKRTGSFYTPREIVDYMADERLKAAKGWKK